MPVKLSGKRESGQPHAVYTFSENIDDVILEKLGVAEGLLDFQHKLQFADNIVDLAELLLEWAPSFALEDWIKNVIHTTIA